MAGMVPWWVWLLPLVRTALVIAFVLVVGVIQGRSTGTYPPLAQWSEALDRLRRWPRSGRHDHAAADTPPPLTGGREQSEQPKAAPPKR
jgi:hypothetical protein